MARRTGGEHPLEAGGGPEVEVDERGRRQRPRAGRADRRGTSAENYPAGGAYRRRPLGATNGQMVVSSAEPDRLDAFVAATETADGLLLGILGDVDDTVAAWNAVSDTYGPRVDPALPGAVVAAATGLAYLDLWVGRVAEGFRAADVSGADVEATIARIAGPADFLVAVEHGRFSQYVIEVPSTGDTRVVRLDLDAIPADLSPTAWQLILVANGLTGATGPIDFVVHGWGQSSNGATGVGFGVADAWDRAGVLGGTVVVVDWPAGDGATAGNVADDVIDLFTFGVDDLIFGGSFGSGVIADFRGAEKRARRTGDVFADVLTGLAAANPDAQVAIQAHSLGNHVAMRGITGMSDPSGRFAVDYTAIQPAVPDDVAGDPAYAGIVGPRVEHLSITINNDDAALFFYEVQGPEALGDEAADGDGIVAILDARGGQGLATTIVDHDSGVGHGHLSLDPDESDIVADLVEAQIERATDR